MSKQVRTAPSAGEIRRNARMDGILDCAEREFAALGYAGTPLHRIAASARVNQALLSYYFGSKEGLYRAIFLRRGRELTAERLRILDELERRKSPPPSVEELLAGFLLPAISLRYQGNDRLNFLKLQARLQNDPREISGKLRAAVFDVATRRYLERLKAALPGIEPAAIAWRMTMTIGAYLYVMSDASRLEQLSDGKCDAEDQQEVVRQITAFLAGGFRAPLPRAARPGRAPGRRRKAAAA